MAINRKDQEWSFLVSEASFILPFKILVNYSIINVLSIIAKI